MLIENKTIKTVSFRSIPTGECFLTTDTAYLGMRIPSVDDTYNAIFLDDGAVTFFNPDDEVISVKAKVVVE